MTPYDPTIQQRLQKLAAVLAAQGNPMMAPQQAYTAICETLVDRATCWLALIIFGCWLPASDLHSSVSFPED